MTFRRSLIIYTKITWMFGAPFFFFFYVPYNSYRYILSSPSIYIFVYLQNVQSTTRGIFIIQMWHFVRRCLGRAVVSECIPTLNSSISVSRTVLTIQTLRFSALVVAIYAIQKVMIILKNKKLELIQNILYLWYWGVDV